MSKLVRNALLLAKTQPTVNVDPIPTGAANAILAGNISINEIEPQFADRANIQPYFGNQGNVLISEKSTISFEVELAGAGVAGNVPHYDPLLLGCAFGKTVLAATSVTYAPITSLRKMVALQFWLDGLLFNLLNCMGNVEFVLSAGGIPMMKYNFTGSFALPTDAAMPAGVNFAGITAPVGVNRNNSPTFTLHGAAPKTQDFNANMNNELVFRNLIGAETIDIVNRKPSGNVSFETEAMAFKNWHTAMRTGTLAPLQMIHGTVPGNIAQIDMPKVQLIGMSKSETDGISMTSMDLAIQPNVGNDELVLTIR